MLKKIVLIILLLTTSSSVSHAHDFNTETMSYILSTPHASWTDFSEYIAGSGDKQLQEEITETNNKLDIVLSLPGKKYVLNYVTANPDFSYTDIRKLIADDPMLSEIGSETIYSFIKAALQEDSPSFSFDFFIRTIYLGFIHISSGYDHILFLLTLIVCLPKARRVLTIVTTFTVAHCMTLVLAGLNLISLPSTIVEPMILISIIIMALYALKNKVGEAKNLYFETLIIFILGLFHGLGFAGFFSSILQTSENIIYPVLGFNIGVELGQLLIIIVILSLLSMTYKYLSKYKTGIKNTLAGGCILVAIYGLTIMFL